MPHTTRLLLVTALVGAACASRLPAQDDHDHQQETLGHVMFPVSCNPEAQARFARAIPTPTVRERGFIAAVGALYRDYESVPNAKRLQAYSDTLARLSRDVPDDPEVAIYYALSLVATASATETTFVRQKQAAAILNPLFRR